MWQVEEMVIRPTIDVTYIHADGITIEYRKVKPVIRYVLYEREARVLWSDTEQVQPIAINTRPFQFHIKDNAIEQCAELIFNSRKRQTNET